MGPVIKAAICGFVIAIVIIIFSPVNTYFLPYLVASLIAIYAFGLKETKDGMLVAFAIYIFTEWILGSLNLVSLLVLNETVSFTVDISMVMSQIFTTLFVLLAGLVGSELANKLRTATTLPSIPEPPTSTLSVSSQPVLEVKLEEKKYCRYCGAQNHNDAVFCEACGKKIG